MHSNMKKALSIIIAALMFGTAAFCMPARRGTFLMYQPDGSTFLAQVRGDEFCRVLTTADGCTVARGEDGFYQYAVFSADGTRTPSGYKVGDKAPATVLGESRNIPYPLLEAKALKKRMALESRKAMKARPASLRPAAETVRKHCLVVLAQFPDLPFQTETRQQDFTDLITQQGYSKGGASGSALDYFNDQFKGAYEFNFTVSGIVTVSRNHDYYGANNPQDNDNDSHPEEIVEEACRLLDPVIDFSQFDDDGDGEVDNVFVIVAGRSEAEGGDADCIWPHQWYVPEGLVLDGKSISSYAISTELSVQGRRSSGQLIWGMAQIGTFCHEYSHTLGLDDLYDTDGEGSGGTADAMWFETDLMDGGGYNNYGKTPPEYNAVNRALLGIGQPEELKAGTWTLEPIGENGRYLVCRNPRNADEYFLFECRRQTGWDTYIGGSGLAIYHVDMSGNMAGYSDDAGKDVTALYRWQYNEVNCNPAHQCADMVETVSGAFSISQVFYPYKTRTSFTVNTDPAFVFNDGTEAPWSVTDISYKDGKVTFNVYNSAEVLPKVASFNCETYQDAMILTWDSDIEGSTKDAVVTWGETSGQTREVTVSPYSPGKYSLTLEWLNPTTAYSIRIVFRNGELSGDSFEYDTLTKARQGEKPPYIYLDYLSGVRVNGMFPAGTGLPLRLANAIGAQVEWYFDSQKIGTDGSGYYHVTKSGTLKAVATLKDGSKNLVVKEITVM